MRLRRASRPPVTEREAERVSLVARLRSIAAERERVEAEKERAVAWAGQRESWLERAYGVGEIGDDEYDAGRAEIAEALGAVDRKLERLDAAEAGATRAGRDVVDEIVALREADALALIDQTERDYHVAADAMIAAERARDQALAARDDLRDQLDELRAPFLDHGERIAAQHQRQADARLVEQIAREPLLDAQAPKRLRERINERRGEIAEEEARKRARSREVLAQTYAAPGDGFAARR